MASERTRQLNAWAQERGFSNYYQYRKAQAQALGYSGYSEQREARARAARTGNTSDLLGGDRPGGTRSPADRRTVTAGGQTIQRGPAIDIVQRIMRTRAGRVSIGTPDGVLFRNGGIRANLLRTMIREHEDGLAGVIADQLAAQGYRADDYQATLAKVQEWIEDGLLTLTIVR